MEKKFKFVFLTLKGNILLMIFMTGQMEYLFHPNSYYEHESTCRKYVPVKGEPKMLEYRIEPKNESDVQVYSLTFVKSEFFENVKNYSEGEFLKF